jgi:germination protein YpeB
MQPIMLINQPQVSRQDAAKHVADAFKLDPASVKFEGEGTGNIPVYSFSAPSDGGTLHADVTKSGGFIINMMSSRVVKQTKLSVDDSITRAIDFMKSLGVNYMAKNYYVVKNNIITVNFAYTDNNITYYPDLMKVSVAMDNGSIVGFESRGYLMSHGKRTLPDIKVSEDKVRKSVADGLKVESVRLAVIPSMGKYELFCYELKCVDKSGQRYLIYKNVETGVEEQILILVIDGNGELSI